MKYLKKYKWWAIIGGLVIVVGIAYASSNSAPTNHSSYTPTYGVQQTQTQPTLSNDNYYTNSSGNSVHSPAYSETGTVPAGATAQCADGTYSFSQHHSGTCSHHGGVSQWLQ